MKRTILTIIALAALSVFRIWGWGGTEHRMMAAMAEQHLTPATRAFLDRYLDQSLTAYASWMDRYRDSPGYEHTTHCHMVSVNADGTFPADGKGKALTLLKKSIDICSSWREHNDSTVHISIVYIIHLVPEIHCPSHYYIGALGEYKEQRRRCFQPLVVGNTPVKYHALWDGSITRLYPKLTYSKFIELFDTWDEAKIREETSGTVEDWARGNCERVSHIYEWCDYGQTVPADFLEQHRDLPEDQARRGGYRLAKVLNDLFDKEGLK